MTIRNGFSAAGTNDIPSLRRAINTAFQGLVSSLNREQIVVKNGSSLPTLPITGQLFLLTAEDGDNAEGFYGHDGTDWLRLDNI